LFKERKDHNIEMHQCLFCFRVGAVSATALSSR
jgi:hypothetical protein